MCVTMTHSVDWRSLAVQCVVGGQERRYTSEREMMRFKVQLFKLESLQLSRNQTLYCTGYVLIHMCIYIHTYMHVHTYIHTYSCGLLTP